MRVLWLTWKDIEHPDAGGAEQVSSAFLRHLAADGHDVTVVTSAPRGPSEVVELDGYRVIRGGNRFTVYWKAFRYVKRHLRDWPDVVIEEINTIPFFSRLYLPEMPRLLLFHQLCREIWFYQLPAPLSWIGYLLEPLYLRLLRGDPVAAVSESTRQDLIRHGFRPEDVTVVSLFVDTPPLEELLPRPRVEEWTLISLGSIRPMKRTLDQVKAFEALRARGVKARLRMAGESARGYGDEVAVAIESSAYSGDIERLGRVSDDQKLAVLRDADLILVTSVKEGWGLVVTEAASQGTPAVVYDVDGLRDSVRNGDTGILTAPQPVALADGVAAALADPDSYAKLRARAWEHSKQFTFERSYGSFRALLDCVLAASRLRERQQSPAPHPGGVGQ